MKKKRKIVKERDYDEEGNWMHTYSKFYLNEDNSLSPVLNLALTSIKNHKSIGAKFINDEIWRLLE